MFPKYKDIEVQINKSALEGTTTASTDTIDIIDKLEGQQKSVPSSRSNSESKLLGKEESSLENIVIEVPKLAMIKQSAEIEQQLVCTTYIPKIKRSRTFSDIYEVSNSSCSSKENSNSSLHDLHRSRSVDKMQKYPSTDSASFKSSNNLLLPPDIHRKNSQERKVTGSKNVRPRLDATVTSPDVSPVKSPNQVNESQRKYKSKKPQNVGHANSAMQLKENEKPTFRKSDSEEHMSNFQRQMRKLVRRVERKAEKQRREILLARLVLLCALVFLVTWLPFVVSILECFINTLIISLQVATRLPTYLSFQHNMQKILTIIVELSCACFHQNADISEFKRHYCYL